MDAIYNPKIKRENVDSFDSNTKWVYMGYAGCVYFIWSMFSDTFQHTMDHLLTFSAALQLLALGMLMLKVHSHNCIDGISLKMLVCYCISFALRLSSTLFFPGYVPEDGTADFYLYQVIEVSCLVACIWLIYQITGPFKHEYNAAQDSMPYWYVLPILSFVMGIPTHSDANMNRFFDICWMASQWLDAVCTLPQMWIVSRAGRVERWTSHFIFWTVIARFSSGLFWSIYTYYDEDAHHDDFYVYTYSLMFTNLLHFVISAEYVYYFIMTYQRKEMQLPGVL